MYGKGIDYELQIMNGKSQCELKRWFKWLELVFLVIIIHWALIQYEGELYSAKSCGMKTITLFLFMLFAEMASAQIGVVTIDEQDPYPIGQWFTLRGEENEGVIGYYSDILTIRAKLGRFLSDYGLTVNEGEMDEEGNLYWGLDNNNGFYVTLSLILDEDMAYLYVYTYPADE